MGFCSWRGLQTHLMVAPQLWNRTAQQPAESPQIWLHPQLREHCIRPAQLFLLSPSHRLWQTGFPLELQSSQVQPSSPPGLTPVSNPGATRNDSHWAGSGGPSLVGAGVGSAFPAAAVRGTLGRLAL